MFRSIMSITPNDLGSASLASLRNAFPEGMKCPATTRQGITGNNSHMVKPGQESWQWA